MAIEYQNGIMIIRLRGESFEQTTQQVLIRCVKLTIEDMLSHPPAKKQRNRIPAVRGFKFSYTHSHTFTVPKTGAFAVTEDKLLKD